MAEETGAGGAEPGSALPGFTPRDLRDPRDMRALAHPTRLALLEVLAVEGPLTATQASKHVGESPSSCSFHLRTLARHGFVEETGEGKGRQRPWKLVTIGTSISQVPTDPETRLAATSLTLMFNERAMERMRHWWATREHEAMEWQEASSNNETMAWLTPAELEEVDEAVLELMKRFMPRITEPDRRPEGARLVEMLFFAYPATLQPGRGSDRPD